MSFAKGAEVWVFYRMNKRCQPSRKYLAVLDPRHGAYRPRQGLSDGWIPARVAADPEQGRRTGEVCVEYRWPHFFTMRGHLVDSKETWTEWYRLADVRKADEVCHSPPRPLIDMTPGSQPALAIIAFRWGGLNEIVPPEQWGETGSSVSDLFLQSFLDIAVVPKLGNNYEVWTVYIEDKTDMIKLAGSAHLIFGANHPVRRAKRTVGMYFLYPTSFEENCVPTMETGEDHGAALVHQKSLFALMQAMEMTGVTTRFPHPSGFYELLASKRWTYYLSTSPQYRVPPTVSLPRMLIEQDMAHAAERGLASLDLVKRQQHILRGEPPPETRITKGVAKLSFSWEALDVKFWERREGLELALQALTQSIEISGELTGQPHDCEGIILQEYMPHDLELRVYVVDGVIEGLIYTKFCKIKENLEFGDFKQLFSRTDAAKQWCGGDQAALDDGEQQCRELTALWITWCQGQLCEMPPAIRFDYFVGRVPGSAGKASVWTLEICELGFSMLGDKKLPAKVFGAMLRSCLSGTGDDTAALRSGSEEVSAPRPNGTLSASQKKRRRKKAGGKAGEAADADADDGNLDGNLDGDGDGEAAAGEAPAS